jgi:hypothetical protein
VLAYLQENISICTFDDVSSDEQKGAIYRISSVINRNFFIDFYHKGSIVQEKLIDCQFIDFCIEKILCYSADDDILVHLTKILRFLFEFKRKIVDPVYYGQIILSKLASCKVVCNI